MKRVSIIVVGLILCMILKSEGAWGARWWEQDGATGDWFGLRPAAAERGFVLGGKWVGTVYGLADGGLKQGAVFDEELRFEARLDFAKATGWECLEGLSAVGGVRLRAGANVNQWVGATPAFNPSSYQSGTGWRLMPFYLSYTSPEVFGVPHFLTISGGWLNPYESFARQEDAKLFRNNVIVSGKGISSNGVGWSSSYAAWGGFLKVSPCPWSYLQGGVYLAIPGDSDSANHGLELAGARPASRNGWYVLGETGVTPEVWGLKGKYAVGGYYWGIENVSFSGRTSDGKFGFYAMGEQMLFRERATCHDGKTASATDDRQGLRWLGFVGWSSVSNNVLPFFFYTGLIYEGLIPTRDHDQAGVAIAFGSYSEDLTHLTEPYGFAATEEGVVEFDYRVQMNKWAFVQPFVQYVVRPGALGTVPNATVLGVHFGVAF